MSRNLGALTLLDPSGPAWPVMGVLYLYLFTMQRSISYFTENILPLINPKSDQIVMFREIIYFYFWKHVEDTDTFSGKDKNLEFFKGYSRVMFTASILN
jgi:hypothetical protein